MGGVRSAKSIISLVLRRPFKHSPEFSVAAQKVSETLTAGFEQLLLDGGNGIGQMFDDLRTHSSTTTTAQ